MANKPKSMKPKSAAARGQAQQMRLGAALVGALSMLLMLGWQRFFSDIESTLTAPMEPPSESPLVDPLMPMEPPKFEDGRKGAIKWMRMVKAMSQWLQKTRAGQRFMQHDFDEKNETLMLSTIGGHAMQYLRAVQTEKHAVPTVVVAQPGRGRGVFYVGDKPLPKGTPAGLYPCLMMRYDLHEEWVKEGRIKDSAFWSSYSINTRLREPDGSPGYWRCSPVGEATSTQEKESGRRGWWKLGELSEADVEAAIEAIKDEVVLDWRKVSQQPNKPVFALNGHIYNEPSGDEPATIDEHLAGISCNLAKQGLKVCGSAMQAKTRLNVLPGQSFAWCYGGAYAGHRGEGGYQVGRACTGVKEQTPSWFGFGGGGGGGSNLY